MNNESRAVQSNSRRRFLKAGAVAVPGLLIGFHLLERRPVFAEVAIEETAGFAPNAFLRVGTDNIVTIISKHIEVGQGVYTRLATLAA